MGSTMEKVRTALALAIVFLLVFTTNRLDKRHFEEVQKNLTAMHEDRVVAQDYLFDISKHFFDKRLRLLSGELMSFAKDDELDTLLARYAKTGLTKKEEEVFLRMEKDISQLQAKGIVNYKDTRGTSAEMLLDRIESNLDELSDIQVKESKSLKIRAGKSLESNRLISNLEIGLILVIGAILQFAIFFGGKRKKAKGRISGS